MKGDSNPWATSKLRQHLNSGGSLLPSFSQKELWAIERARHILAGGDRVELIPQPGGDFKLVRVRHEPQRYEVKHD